MHHCRMLIDMKMIPHIFRYYCHCLVDCEYADWLFDVNFKHLMKRGVKMTN